MRKTFTIDNIHKLIGYQLRILIPPDDEIRMFEVWDTYFEEESYHIKLGLKGEIRLEVENHITESRVRVRLQRVGCKTQYGSVRFEDMGSIDGFIAALSEVRWSSYPLRVTFTPA